MYTIKKDKINPNLSINTIKIGDFTIRSIFNNFDPNLKINKKISDFYMDSENEILNNILFYYLPIEIHLRYVITIIYNLSRYIGKDTIEDLIKKIAQKLLDCSNNDEIKKVVIDYLYSLDNGENNQSNGTLCNSFLVSFKIVIEKVEYYYENYSSIPNFYAIFSNTPFSSYGFPSNCSYYYIQTVIKNMNSSKRIPSIVINDFFEKINYKSPNKYILMSNLISIPKKTDYIDDQILFKDDRGKYSVFSEKEVNLLLKKNKNIVGTFISLKEINNDLVKIIT